MEAVAEVVYSITTTPHPTAPYPPRPPTPTPLKGKKENEETHRQTKVTRPVK